MHPPATPAERATAPFWRETPLAQMTRAQWESLCDGCGKCCLHKLEDEESGRLYFTSVACRLLDHRSCRCTHYAQRTHLVDDCLKLTPGNLHQGKLPSTCAYRLLAEGRDLPDWHPLVTGDPESTHRSGNSVRGRVVGESPDLDLTQHLLVAEGF